MFLWIPAIVCAVFLVLTGRTWMDFTQRQEQLADAIREQERLIAEHTKRLEEVRLLAQGTKDQIREVVVECDELQQRVNQLEGELKQLEERLERVRPKNRQVDKDDTGGDWLWKK